MTPHHTLYITFDCMEGAIVRLFGLIERRGFSIQGIDMPTTDADQRTVTLTVAPMGAAYRIDVLKRQIERLQDVTEVRIDIEKPARNIWGFMVRGATRETVTAQ